MSSFEIERRLTAIESELANLKASSAVSRSSHPIRSIERIHAIFKNDPAFKQAMELGREWRQSDRPVNRKSKVKRR